MKVFRFITISYLSCLCFSFNAVAEAQPFQVDDLVLVPYTLLLTPQDIALITSSAAAGNIQAQPLKRNMEQNIHVKACITQVLDTNSAGITQYEIGTTIITLTGASKNIFKQVTENDLKAMK